MKREFYEQAKGCGRKMKEWVVEEYGGEPYLNDFRVANYGILFEDGYFYHSDCYICHAGIRYGHKEGLEDLVPAAIVSMVQKLEVEEPVAVEFYRWLLNESPYSSVFKTKSFNRAKEYGIITHVDVNCDLLAGGLIASRFPTEHPYHCNMWWSLVKNGCNKDLAYLMSTCCRIRGDSIYFTYMDSHCSVDSFHISEGYATNFLNHRKWEGAENNGKYRDSKTYFNVGGYWGSSSRSWLKVCVGSVPVKRLGVAEVKNNPFKRVSDKDDIDGWCKEVIAKVVGELGLEEEK